MVEQNTGHKADTARTCHHCGEDCPKEEITFNNYCFCCNGCMMVYKLLDENGMTAYYDYEQSPGINQRVESNKTYEYLNDSIIQEKLLTFKEGNTSKISLTLPQIHCSSCLWLLENINKLNPGISSSRVNFMKKEATIQFDHTKITLQTLVELLSKIGYEPRLNFNHITGDKKQSTTDKTIVYQIGLAGFVFGNIMLLSFPEYLGFHQASVKFSIGYINILLAIPLLLYGGKDYLKSAFVSLRQNHLNIDVPVAIGMITLFGRSVYEIISQTGEGYLDSLAGFIFFLLIGKWFQSFTYKTLDFDRSYESYFPISANLKKDGKWIATPLHLIQKDDVILIRNQELIPSDGVLIKGNSNIDYSFVTGESDLISKQSGDKVLAGGKHNGSNIHIKVEKSVDQSYLTQLWNEDTFKTRTKSSSVRLVENISKYFTYIVLLIALGTLVFWMYQDSSIAFNAFTAVLIVACPCALALAIPFTYGNILRLLAEEGFFLRNVSTIEDVQDIEHIVFDKTGTLTDNNKLEMTYNGAPLMDKDWSFIKSSCMHSSHPLSKALAAKLYDYPEVEIVQFQEEIGSGIITQSSENSLKLGSSRFVMQKEDNSKAIYIELNGQYVGKFEVKHAFRTGVFEIISRLQKKFKLSVISGDNERESQRLKSLFLDKTTLLFNQSPKHKLDFIKSHQDNGEKVMMIGDGLNDAGALKQSNVGIVISDANNNFSPACDAILTAKSFDRIHAYINYLKSARNVIYGAFVLAFLYNIIGLYFAISGNLSPVIAAILMPLSSITVIVYGVFMSFLLKKIVLRKESF